MGSTKRCDGQPAQRYCFVAWFNFAIDGELSIERRKFRSGTTWDLSPPDPEGHYHFCPGDKIGSILCNDGLVNLRISNANILFENASGPRNPFAVDTRSLFSLDAQLVAPGSSNLVRQGSLEAWWLPGTFADSYVISEALAQEGTYTKTLSFDAMSNDETKSFSHDPTWKVGDGEPLNPP